ncbi:MAG: hypothetical protein C4563_09920 [Desulfobulbus sp.]|nr:MAG: hypothetical protein C4563_09920 [Desulfobulbus sp.]
MLPRLGKKFDIPVEVVTKPREAYQSMAYADLGLPRAPAIMLGGEILVQGKDIAEQELEAMIRRNLAGPK